MRSCWNLKYGNLLATLFTWLYIGQLLGQYSLHNEIPLVKTVDLQPYLFPINPGQANFLAGTMGELRTTHFHAGIDVRTNSMVGVPVLATQQGYVSRILVGAYGYGNAIIISHPDGNSSLYGHLDKFKGPIATHVLQEHYRRKSFDLDLTFDSNQFPINRGDTIGLSGNTGGSSGPHLHFEIRDENNLALNPLAFGFTEVKDVFAPVAIKVALVTMDVNSRINDKFGRFEFSLIRVGNTYSLPYPIFARGKIGIELLGHDRIDRSHFRCGINYIEVMADSASIFTQQIDKINFNHSYDITAHLDFKALKTRGLRFNKLYLSDGNPLELFKNVENKGIVSIDAGSRSIRIKLRDFSTNESQIKFTLKSSPVAKQVSFLETPVKPIDYEVIENTLVVHAKKCVEKSTTLVFAKGKKDSIEPSYSGLSKEVYLIDLRTYLPDSISTCSGTLRFSYKDKIPSGTDYQYFSDDADIEFKNGTLYDTLFLNTDYEVRNNREVFTIGTLLTPIHKTISVLAKPKNQYTNQQQTAAYHVEGKRLEYLGGQWQNGKIKFDSHELGEFTLATDSIAPSIRRIYCNGNSARFRIGDNLSGVESFEASINGEWLLMKYDYKTGIVQSERLDKKKLLKGNFKLVVRDRAGNEKIHQQKIL
jgi:hypothetical protein